MWKLLVYFWNKLMQIASLEMLNFFLAPGKSLPEFKFIASELWPMLDEGEI